MERENDCCVVSVTLSILLSQDKYVSFLRDFHITEVRFYKFACNNFIFNFRMTFDSDHIISYGWCVFEVLNSE
jgi:hypothetical protein